MTVQRSSISAHIHSWKAGNVSKGSEQHLNPVIKNFLLPTFLYHNNIIFIIVVQIFSKIFRFEQGRTKTNKFFHPLFRSDFAFHTGSLVLTTLFSERIYSYGVLVVWLVFNDAVHIIVPIIVGNV